MTEIHPTAVIAPEAKIGTDCVIGPYCVIGKNVELGDRCRLHSHVVIDGYTTLGTDNEIFPFASLGMKSQDLKWRGGITYTRIGNRNTLREAVTVNSGTGEGEVTQIGDNNLIMAYCHVAHNCCLGNHIIISNGLAMAGHVTVEDYAVISGLVTVHQFVRIGTMAIIGGSSKATQDVPPYVMADGNPVRPRGLNKVGLTRRGVSAEAQLQLKRAYKLFFRSGMALDNSIKELESQGPLLPEAQHLVDFIKNSPRGVCR